MADQYTRTISGPAAAYATWASSKGVTGGWDATDASGVANVFRYAFDLPDGELKVFGAIEFDENGRAVVVTSPLVNGQGFAFEVVASDNPDGTGNEKAYPLDPDGETVIVEGGKERRFFRLRATQMP